MTRSRRRLMRRDDSRAEQPRVDIEVECRAQPMSWRVPRSARKATCQEIVTVWPVRADS
jgi:hypothetical protein